MGLSVNGGVDISTGRFNKVVYAGNNVSKIDYSGTRIWTKNIKQSICAKNNMYHIIKNTGVVTVFGAKYKKPLLYDSSFSAYVVTSTRVYTIGAFYSGAPSAGVYYSEFDSDNAIGNWVSGTSLPAAVGMSGYANTSTNIYVLGGAISGNVTAACYKASIDSSGGLGAWSTVSSLPTARCGMLSFVTSNRIYVVGGIPSYTSTVPVTNVYYATINADGTLGSWTAGTALPGGVYRGKAIIISSKVHLISTGTSSIYTATINADGSIGAWSASTTMPGAGDSPAVIVTPTKLYVSQNISNPNAYIGTINADGSIGSWVTSSVFQLSGNKGTVESVGFLRGRTAYLLGGRTSGSSGARHVRATTLNTDDSMTGAWSAAGEAALPKQIANITNCIHVAVGNLHAAHIESGGNVKVSGDNTYGQLGLGNTTSTSLYAASALSGITNCIKTACGMHHTVFLLSNGTVKACGRNDYGQLGDGTNTNRTSPVNVSGISNCVDVVCGDHHTFFLFNDGSTKATGLNTSGQLGDGTNSNRSTPVNIANNVVGIAAAGNHTFIVITNGDCFGAGSNTYGQLGTGNYNNTNTFTKVVTSEDILDVTTATNKAVFLTHNMTHYAAGYNYGFGAGINAGINNGSITSGVFTTPTIMACSVANLAAAENKFLSLAANENSTMAINTLGKICITGWGNGLDVILSSTTGAISSQSNLTYSLGDVVSKID